MRHESPDRPPPVLGGVLRSGGSLGGFAVKWMPIESAPKDGTGVLGFINPTWVEGIFWNGDEWSYLSDGDITPAGRHQPTHWMPLPELPK